MNISMIAAVGKNYELGKDNRLIWHFKEDMAFFKSMTNGATVIMGRKTFESLPKALPGRKNIVISTNHEYSPEGALCVSSVEEALKEAGENVFIIGGASVYAAFLPLADTFYLTEIDATCEDADTFFPLFDKSEYRKKILNTITVDGVRLVFNQYIKL